jgi:NAD(P)-dependent dehydrogenase (short-subunit alcohol dehydrogenase family)
MNLNLNDKVVIVTGGSKGIGLGIVKSLIKEKAIPVIIGRDKKSIEEVVNKYESQGSKLFYSIAELTKPQDCKEAVENVIKKYKRIDAIVNNAGDNDGVSLENGNYKDFLSSLHKNLIHYYLIAHYSLESLKKSKGVIINIGSKTSFTGQGGTSGYTASNGGRNSLTREWAVELLPYDIRVNSVIVAECYTPMYDRWIKSQKNPKSKLEKINKKIPFQNRMTTVEEIADTVVFLISEKSSHTTGQLIFVDGGYTHLDRAL